MQKNGKTNNELYLERTDLVPQIMSYEAFIKANQRNGSFWIMMPNPFDGRMPMVHFESMRPSFKDKINTFYGGNVYDHFAKVPIKKLVITDAKAEQFFNDHRYGNNVELPPDIKIKYVIAASWLNMMLKATEEKAFVKKELNLSLDQFWNNVISIIKTDNIDLPTSYGNLVAKPDSAIKQYKASGYASLIHKNYGNKSAAKIGKTEEGFCPEREQQQIAVIRKIARLPMNWDAVQITSTANQLFEKNNWATVSPATVANLVALHMPNIIGQKRGGKVYNNTVSMQVKREAPQFPSYYWTLDGWTVELLYQDGTKYHNRLVMVVVLDACNKYPVGYAIGERENTELIRMALRNAVIHMQDLFGAAYRPWQLQSDRYGLKNLTSFYSGISHLYTPAAVGNAKAKIIEPWFKYYNKKHCQKKRNWSGFNVNSQKKNQPNVEALDVIKRTFPDKATLIETINRDMLNERLSLVEDFKRRWQQTPQDDQVTLTPAQCIEVFGKPHDEWNSISGQGLIATLDGRLMTFDSFEPAFRALQFSTRFKIIYDSCDFNQVLAITEDGKQKFLLHNKVTIGMGYKNTTPEQLEYHQQIKEFNSQRKEDIIQTYLLDDAIVEDIIANTPLNLSNQDELDLKLMFTTNGQQKEALQDAKGLKRIQQKEKQTAAIEDKKETVLVNKNWEQEQAAYRASKTDFNQYLDNN